MQISGEKAARRNLSIFMRHHSYPLTPSKHNLSLYLSFVLLVFKRKGPPCRQTVRTLDLEQGLAHGCYSGNGAGSFLYSQEVLSHSEKHTRKSPEGSFSRGWRNPFAKHYLSFQRQPKTEVPTPSRP